MPASDEDLETLRAHALRAPGDPERWRAWWAQVRRLGREAQAPLALAQALERQRLPLGVPEALRRGMDLGPGDIWPAPLRWLLGAAPRLVWHALGPDGDCAGFLDDRGHISFHPAEEDGPVVWGDVRAAGAPAWTGWGAAGDAVLVAPATGPLIRMLASTGAREVLGEAGDRWLAHDAVGRRHLVAGRPGEVRLLGETPDSEPRVLRDIHPPNHLPVGAAIDPAGTRAMLVVSTGLLGVRPDQHWTQADLGGPTVSRVGFEAPGTQLYLLDLAAGDVAGPFGGGDHMEDLISFSPDGGHLAAWMSSPPQNASPHWVRIYDLQALATSREVSLSSRLADGEQPAWDDLLARVQEEDSPPSPPMPPSPPVPQTKRLILGGSHFLVAAPARFRTARGHDRRPLAMEQLQVATTGHLWAACPAPPGARARSLVSWAHGTGRRRGAAVVGPDLEPPVLGAQAVPTILGGSLRIVDLAGGAVRYSARLPDGAPFRALAMTPDEQKVLLVRPGLEDQLEFVVWNVATDSEAHRVVFPDFDVPCGRSGGFLDFRGTTDPHATFLDAAGSVVVLDTGGSRVRIWGPEGDLLGTWDVPGPDHRGVLRVYPEAGGFLVTTRTGWFTGTRGEEPRAVLGFEPLPRGFGLAPDGAALAYPDAEGMIEVLDLDCRRLARLEAPAPRGKAVALGPGATELYWTDGAWVEVLEVSRPSTGTTLPEGDPRVFLG